MRKVIGASESSSIYIWGVCAGSILSTLFSLVLSKVGYFAGMPIATWVCYVIMQIGFIATIFIYSSIRKIDVLSLARINRGFNWRQLILLPFIAIATILVFLPLANLWSAFLNLIGYRGGVSVPLIDNVGLYFLSLLILAVIPAIGEEFLMRGCVFPGLSTRNIWFGILMSGLFFSLMHANPMQTVHQFGLGVVLAITLCLTGSIWCGVIIHFLNNFISLTLTAYLPQVDAIYVSLGYWNWLTGFASLVVGLFMLVILFYLLYRANGNKDYSVTDNGIVYGEYTLYVRADDEKEKKHSFFKDLFLFIKSLFTRNGWRNVTNKLSACNGIQEIGKAQNMIGVWIALGLVCVYWLLNFIAGLV